MEPTEEIVQLRAIVGFQSELAACGLDLEAVLECISGRVAALVGADSAVLELADPSVLSSTGRSAPATGSPRPDAKESEIICCADIAGDPRLASDLRRRFESGSLLRVPLLHRGQLVGTVNLLAAEVGGLGADAERAMSLIRGSIAAHIANADNFAREAHGSSHDGLTGLLNRRAYEQRLAAEIARARRYGRPLSLCLLDLDDFKALNDSLGHPAGDDVLRQVALAIRRSRLADRGFRIGGDEFAILMPETTIAAATAVIERLIASLDVESASVGVSFGIANDPLEATAMHAAADLTLLAAKDRVHRRPFGRREAATAS